MDFDPTQYMKLLAALLLIPGLIFLFIVVFYVAFIGKTAPAKVAAREEQRGCLQCGRTLLPDQAECPTCSPQLIMSTMNEEPAEATAEVVMEEEPLAPADISTAYDGELVEDEEPPRTQS